MHTTLFKHRGRWRAPIGLVTTLLVTVLLTQGPGIAARAQTGGGRLQVTGTLTLMWAFPHSGDSLVVRLTADDGTGYRLRVAKETVGASGLLGLDRQRVQVTGLVTTTRSADARPPVLEASEIRPVEGKKGAEGASLDAAVTGSQPFVSILCRFSDATGVTPKDTTYFNGLLGSTQPGISDFWRENSFNGIDNAGSTVVGWFNLPNPRSHYVFDEDAVGGIYWDRLARDCTAAADPSVNFNSYVGINLMFNQRLDCCAWGGGERLTLDGTNKIWPMTWMPPGGFNNQDILAHEMGHAYGLPHSGSTYDTAYDSNWDVMSGGGTCSPVHGTYGCIGVHTIAYHKDTLGWIPPDRKYTAAPSSNVTITLEDVAGPAAGSGTYLMAQIPIGTSTTDFFTVEARKPVGYDNQIPGEAVIVHRVNTTRERPAQVVDVDNNGNPNDAAARWLPGETFTDPGTGVTVAVLSGDANGFQVRIERGALPPPPNDNYPGDNVSPPRAGQPTRFSGIVTAAATTEAGEPTNVCASTGRTVWYRFRAPVSAELTVDTAGSSYDTVLAVFTGGSVGALSPVSGACNDDPSGTTRARVVFTPAANTDYYVQAGGFSGASGNLDIEFRGDFPVPAPPNDNFPGADVTPPVAGQSRTFSVNTVGATTQSGEPTDVCTNAPGSLKPSGADVSAVPTGHTVWYNFIAPTSGELTIDTAGSSFDTVLAVFTGGSVGALSPVPGACKDDVSGSLQAKVVFTPGANTHYYVQAGGYSANAGTLNIAFSGDFAATPPAPTNPNAFAVGPSTIRVTWQDNASNETGYEINNGDVSRTAAANSTHFDWTGLAPGTYMCFRVRAFNGAGSSGFTPDTPPFYVCATTVASGTDVDYDGDAKGDIGVYRPSTGTWYVNRSAGGVTAVTWGVSTDQPVSGDFDGDGKTDIAVWRPSNGTWYVSRSSGGASVVAWGVSSDVPVAADYDGDGKTDIAVWRPSDGAWYVNRSSGGVTVVTWGVSSDIPVAADYDGDGKTDIAVWRPSNGTWYVSRSSGGASVVTWGLSTDVPVAADYDGDSKADVAVWRPSTGVWFVNRSSGGVTALTWGVDTDVAVPNDYDGDGRVDIGVWRPSTGTWYVSRSSGGATVVTWGVSTDVPIRRPPLR